MEKGCGKTNDVCIIDDNDATLDGDLDLTVDSSAQEDQYDTYNNISGLGGIMSYNNFDESLELSTMINQYSAPPEAERLDTDQSGPNALGFVFPIRANVITCLNDFAYGTVSNQMIRAHDNGDTSQEFTIVITEHIPLLHKVPGTGGAAWSATNPAVYRGLRQLDITFAHTTGIQPVFHPGSVIESRRNPTWYSEHDEGDPPGYHPSGAVIQPRTQVASFFNVDNDATSGEGHTDGDYHLAVSGGNISDGILGSATGDTILSYLPAVHGSTGADGNPIVGNILDIGCKIKITKNHNFQTEHSGVTVSQATYSVTALLNHATPDGNTNLGGKFVFH